LPKYSELELNLLFVFYCYSDQFGKVDTLYVRDFVRTNLGLTLPHKQIFINQTHIDALVAAKLVPDVSKILAKAVLGKRTRRPKN
jgi:citrate lyase alpha subunit